VKLYVTASTCNVVMYNEISTQITGAHVLTDSYLTTFNHNCDHMCPDSLALKRTLSYVFSVIIGIKANFYMELAALS